MFKQFFYAWRSLWQVPRQTIIKIVSLCFGIGVAILLLARVAYLYSYDRSFRDYGDIYQLWMTWQLTDRTIGPTQICIGAFSRGVMDGMSDVVESAASCGWFNSDCIYKDDVVIEGSGFAADSLIFDALGITVLEGNPRTQLQEMDKIFISDRIAERYFKDQNPIGQKLNAMDWMEVEIAGIYKSIPLNSTVKPDYIFSLPTLWNRNSGNYSWHGGDSWKHYVRVKKDANVSIEELNRRLNDIIQQNAPDSNGMGIRAEFRPLTYTALSDPSMRRMAMIMTILAVAILLITALNYVLIAISSLSRRAKAVGVHKTSGAEPGDILRMFAFETLFIILGAMVLFVLMLLQFREFVEETLESPVSLLFASERLYVVIGVIFFTFLIGALIPGVMMSRIGVTTVFRSFTEKRQHWKRTLLFVQIAGVTFIMGILVVVFAQYHYVLNKDLGYNPKNLAMLYSNENYDFEAMLSHFGKLPYVKDCSFSTSIPVRGYSGEMIPDNTGQMQFSAKYDYANEDYLDFLGVKLIAGRKHRRHNEILINREFCRLMGWTLEQAINQESPLTTEEGLVKIVGVVEDFVIGTFFDEPRAFVFHWTEKDRKIPHYNCLIQLRLAEPFDRSFEALKEEVAMTYPLLREEPLSVERRIKSDYEPLRLFRNLTIVAALALIFIAVMGLVGYLNDEIQRRAKEIAIRKVNGAEASSIVGMLLGDVMKAAVPACVLGCVASWWLGDIWMQQFVVVVVHLWAYYVISALCVLALILVSVGLLTWHVANSSPVNYLKSE